ncbi:MAG: DMT family transporter [Burkholderiaceae bacterium]
MLRHSIARLCSRLSIFLAQLGPHARAVGLMAIVAFLWSLAGVVSRHLSPTLVAEGKFEIVFWRSAFAALFVFVMLARQGFDLRRWLRDAGVPGLVSACCWAGMFTAYMIALAYTSVARVLVLSALGPLATAVLSRLLFSTLIPTRTWLALMVASVGLTWMVAHAGASGARPAGHDVTGMLIAALVPLCSAINLVTLQRWGKQFDFVPTVMLGATLSAGFALVCMGGFHANLLDVFLLAVLGVFQLGLPCMLMVLAAQRLSATEVALLGLLETVLGPLWAWLGAGEVPTSATLTGGALVVAALVANEAAARRRPLETS